MSAQLIEVLVPVPVVSPQGALWAAQAAVWLGRTLGRFGRSVWQALEAHGNRRAARELHAAAERWQGREPALAQTLLAGTKWSLRAFTRVRAATPEQTVARDVAAVRALAESWRNTDPGFASDLHAAASRHESSFDAAALAAR